MASVLQIALRGHISCDFTFDCIPFAHENRARVSRPFLPRAGDVIHPALRNRRGLDTRLQHQHDLQAATLMAEYPELEAISTSTVNTSSWLDIQENEILCEKNQEKRVEFCKELVENVQ